MAAFETKQYRNLFSLIGKEDQEINNRLNEIFETFFYGSEEERIYHPVGEDMGYLEDTGNHDARTEGMSYGMMICVQMNKKEEFDRIWKWACRIRHLNLMRAKRATNHGDTAGGKDLWEN